MKTAYRFEGQSRQGAGTSEARTLRNQGKVPSVLYGKNGEPVHFAIELKDIIREYHKGGFFAKLVTLVIDGKEVYGVPKDVQLHPVSDLVIHADFMRVEKNQDIKVLVPVRFINADRCVGIRRGGALNVVRYQLELFCNPESIPDEVVIDLLTVNIGDSIHISSIPLPEGVRPTIDRDFTIAAIAGRASKVAKEGEGAE